MTIDRAARIDNLRARAKTAWSLHHSGDKLPGESLGLPGWADVARRLEARAAKLEAEAQGGEP